MVSTAAFHAIVRGSVPGLGGLKETKLFLPHPRVKVSIVGSLRDREVAYSASDRQGSNFESCVWRTVSSQSSHHPQEVLLAQFSLYVHKGGLNPDSFHFMSLFAQSLQYRDRRKPGVWTMPYSYRMTFFSNAQDNKHHCTIQVLEQFGALYMRNPDDKHSTQDSNPVPLSFKPQPDLMILRACRTLSRVTEMCD